MVGRTAPGSNAAEEAIASEELVLKVLASDGVIAFPLPPTGSVTIGRAEGNDLRIDDPSVSRRHAVLHVGPPLCIEDLGGANGTFVTSPQEADDSGKTIDIRQISRGAVEIAIGDRVSVGNASFVVGRADRVATEEPPSSQVGDAVVQSPAMKAVYEQASLAAKSNLAVLVLGETGAGKEVLARTIHQRSLRADGPFLGLSCAALSESLLESELFGHEKGAFTGALQARPGLFEAAQGGTLFLDEVGELPIPFQVKLLRVLEERKVLRVGARVPRDIDVRFVAATNRDLEAEVARGTFREDLYYRLNGITLTLPPLRERQTEIPELARRFVAAACRQLDRARPLAIAAETLDALARYAWRGNVRELKNVMERAVALCTGETILPSHLPPKVASSAGDAAAPLGPELPKSGVVSGDSMETLRRNMMDAERQRIIEALARCAGHQGKAAELLGISRRTLVTRLGDHNIPRPRKG